MHDSSEAEGCEGNKLCFHHAHHPTPRNQSVHILHSCISLVAGIHSRGDFCDRRFLEDKSQDARRKGGEQHSWDGWFFCCRKVKNDDHREKKQQVEVKMSLQGLGDAYHGLGFDFLGSVFKSDQEINKESYQPCWSG